MIENTSEYELIHPTKYIKNLKSYQFCEIIEVDSEINFDIVVSRENFKDFFSFAIDNDVEILSDKNLKYQATEFKSSYVYMIFDLNHLYEIYEGDIIYLLLDFIDLLDIDNKFKMLNDFYHSNSYKYIIKLQHIPRNIGVYPIIEGKCEKVLEYLSLPKYK